LCSGLLRIDEVIEHTGYAAPSGDYETLGGLVLTRFARIPEAGDRVVLPTAVGESEDDAHGGWIARVESMDGRRIDRILVRPAGPEEMGRLRGTGVEDDRG
jgi:CBS domain containing-hemolysin-like protein